jgi:hypothetical protein
MALASWRFYPGDDGRMVAETHVVGLGKDALEAAAQCVNHLLLDLAHGVAVEVVRDGSGGDKRPRVKARRPRPRSPR